mmetsp:Transcript_49832/g.112068  ORF Transcript_49832/g.112068 Transcript_49832/m.112068 type:complete len:233 (+) Transcript_49832:279-977(+)
MKSYLPPSAPNWNDMPPARRPPAPKRLPSVTKMMFFITMSATLMSAPAILPRGRKNMLATECSRPMPTNIGMQDQIPKILPGRSAAETARKMAMETSQLHSVARIRTCPAGIEHFLRAVAATRSAAPPLSRPALLISLAIVRQPQRLPKPERANERSAIGRLILPSYHAAVTSAKLPVISWPAAWRMKMSPIGKMSPTTHRCRSGPRPGIAPATTRENMPPMATYMPPMKAW